MPHSQNPDNEREHPNQPPNGPDVSDLPLAAGLRALAEESRSRRLRHSLFQMSDALAAGSSIEEALLAHGRGLPRSLYALMQSGLESRRLGLLIEQTLTYARHSRDARRASLLQVAYPIVLMLALFLLCYVFSREVIPEFIDIFQSFGVDLPGITIAVISASEFLRNYGHWFPIAMLLAFVLFYACYIVIAGKASWRRLIDCTPILGPVLRYSSLSQFCHHLAILIESRIPLPDALGLTGDTVNDSNIREGCRLLAAEVRNGTPLVEAAQRKPNFSVDVISLFRWEQRDEAFPKILHATGDIFLAQSRVSAGIITVVLEPLVILGVAAGAGFLVLALFAPLIWVMNALS